MALSFSGLSRERVGIALLEVPADGATPVRTIDNHKAPWLAQTYRGGKTGNLDQTLECDARKRLAVEPPHVATPQKQLEQCGSEVCAELWKWITQ